MSPSPIRPDQSNNALPVIASTRVRVVVDRSAGERRPGFRSGKMRPMILLWALGVPIPIILVILLIRGCVG